MSLINTSPIWRALGDFFSDIFPDEERVYFDTFWEAYSDIVADLWGYSFQVDRSKSLFSTTALTERREVLVLMSNGFVDDENRFRISNLKESAGTWVLRGFVPRDSRTFSELPDRGMISIGVDKINYLSVNVTTSSDGFIREASFVLEGEPPHDYTDSPNFNDDFSNSPVEMQFRIDATAGDLVVDAVADIGVVINPTGLLTLGGVGLNREQVEYESYSKIGDDRYVFTLATSYQSPDLSAEDLVFDHSAGEGLAVHKRDADSWIQTTSGNSRIIADGDIDIVIDQFPAPSAASAIMAGQVQLGSNSDFDISVTASLGVWGTPSANDKTAFTRLNIGPNKYTAGIKSTSVGHFLIHGILGSESETALSEIPSGIEFRFKRIAGSLEIQYRNVTDDNFIIMEILSVSGERSSLDFGVDDTLSGSVSRVTFDEVIRRGGVVVGNARLEEFFFASEEFPITYDIDQNIVSADRLQDSPRTFSENFVVVSSSDGEIVATGSRSPDAGILTIDDKAMVFYSVVELNGVFTFSVEIDPDLELTGGESMSVDIRVMSQGIDYELSGDGQISLRETPTSERVWAPVANIDDRHIQNHWGVLTNLDADISSAAYLSRVQGTWFALMSGPSMQNMHTGLQLAMGLPVARTSGTIVEIVERFDALGRRTGRALTILGDDGTFEHSLNPDLYPFIDWIYNIGEPVEKFAPLTNGVKVSDVVSDNDWHLKFSGVGDIERFNNFGISVDLEALTAEASVEDALRFALRIKPTYTKMVMHFVLNSGNEDLSEELDDTANFVINPIMPEDMGFDEGDVPDNPIELLTLGQGHKLGQGKTLGNNNHWKENTLGTYQRQGPYIGDGSTTAGSDVFTGSGGNFVDGTTRKFHSGDIGKNIFIMGEGDHKIVAILSDTTVQVMGSFSNTASDLDWEMRDYMSLGEGFTLGSLQYYKTPVPGQQQPSEYLDAFQIVHVTASP